MCPHIDICTLFMSKTRDLPSNLCCTEMAFNMLSRHNPMGEKQKEPKYEDPILL